MVYAKDVSVVTSDNVLVVDGVGREFNYPRPDNVHAIQWHKGQGSVEYTDDTPVHYFDVTEYKTFIAPYVEALNEYVKKEEEEHKRLINSRDYKESTIRVKRDWLLNDSQWVVDRQRDQINAGIPSTLSVEEFQDWLDYRQALRDITIQPGFPWNGADDPKVPWPVEPTVR